jgi:PhnB protein
MAEQTVFPGLVPSIMVNDVKGTLAWFSKLGFNTEVEMPAPDGSIVHAEVSYAPDVRIMLGPAGMGGGQPGSTGMSLYITLKDSVDAYHNKVKAAGITIKDQLTDQFWGDRTFMVEHPDGYQIMFAQHTRDVTPEEMSEAMKQMAPA